MWQGMIDRMLARLVRRGSLRMTFPDGTTRTYGDGGEPRVAGTIHDRAVLWKMIRDTDLATGEAYMDGTLTIEDDDLHGMFQLVLQNRWQGEDTWYQRLQKRYERAIIGLKQRNIGFRSRKNVAHHYDLSPALYDLFLDEDRQYSCAYFPREDMTLEEAQEAKKHHIAQKLMLKPGMRVLDIGCGWGGMALTLARDYGVEVVGVTLSTEQHRTATERAEAAGLSDKVDIRLSDYRKVPESFDRIVSVGMFEHVGAPYFREYFRQVSRMLAPDGIALIHTIGRIDPPGFTGTWLEKYIFPGGYIPALSEMMAAVEDETLYHTDVEVLRLHYAKTLNHWFRRFKAREDEARELYDERFCRMWRFYLSAAEMSFRAGRQAVFQVQLVHNQNVVPLTRDYMYDGQGAGVAQQDVAAE